MENLYLNLVLIYYIIRYKRGFHLLAHSIKRVRSLSIKVNSLIEQVIYIYT